MPTPLTGPAAPTDRNPERPAWAQYLSTLRESRTISRSAAARLIGVTQQTWTGIESGMRTRGNRRTVTTPTEETLQRIISAFALTAEERGTLLALAYGGTTGSQDWQLRLRDARLAAQMEPAEAARLAGVATATYRRWELRPGARVRHDALRSLLPHLGVSPADIEAFLALVPAEGVARAPRQPSNPVSDVPAWSQFITDKRVARGLPLSQVDEILGQASILRRFELGGWRRADGRYSIPPRTWLDRIAAALDMNRAETAHLHTLADAQRLTSALHGRKPLTAEVLYEARRAADLSQAEAEQRVGPLPVRWARIESGSARALTALTPAVMDRIAATLPVPPLLLAALHGSIHPTPETAEIKGECPDRETPVQISA